MDFGPCEFNQSGISPVTYQEIKSWADVTGLVLVDDEAQILKRMSSEYCASYIKSRDPNCPPPYVAEANDDTMAAINEHTKQQMLKLMRA